jgi:aerobic carbon-monoxide dehydrogenase small subunit
MARVNEDRSLTNVDLIVNGDRYVIEVEPRCTLADALREKCGKTGTNLGCEHGICGACTVLLDGEPVRACLLFAVQLQGKSIRTVEGLAQDGRLHELQRAFTEHHALQCGYCTPGFLMLAVSYLERNSEVDEEEIRDLVASNLCRCTGYQNIVQAICTAAERLR